MASFRVLPAVALAGVLASAQASLAAEGGFSFYLPGLAGDIALAQSSEPGLQVANTVFFQSGDAGAAVLQGNVNLALDLTLALDIVSAGYTFQQKVLAATYTVQKARLYSARAHGGDRDGGVVRRAIVRSGRARTV